MLVHTFKSIVVGFATTCPVDKISLTARGETTGKKYKIVSRRNKISVSVDNTHNIMDVFDFELFKFNDSRVNIEIFEKETFKKGSEPYEYYRVYPDYPVVVFIELFRALKMRASFTIKYKDKFIDCYYISDKVRWREETENYCNIHCSDLYKLNTIFPGYEIVTVGSPYIRHNFKEYMSKEEEIAQALGKHIRKYDNGIPYRSLNAKIQSK